MRQDDRMPPEGAGGVLASANAKDEGHMSTLYEIIELPNGDVALQRVDEEGEPLVSIRFSQESVYFLNDAKIEVAKAMIEAGLEAAGEIQEVESGAEALEEDEDFGVAYDSTVIH